MLSFTHFYHVHHTPHAASLPFSPILIPLPNPPLPPFLPPYSFLALHKHANPSYNLCKESLSKLRTDAFTLVSALLPTAPTLSTLDCLEKGAAAGGGGGGGLGPGGGGGGGGGGGAVGGSERELIASSRFSFREGEVGVVEASSNTTTPSSKSKSKKWFFNTPLHTPT